MKRRWRAFVLAGLVIMTLLLGGCRFGLSNLLGVNKEPEPPQLMKVEIRFTNGMSLTGYVKELGVPKDGVIYVGGESANHLYDSQGNVIGVFNYKNVLYMKVIR